MYWTYCTIGGELRPTASCHSTNLAHGQKRRIHRVSADFFQTHPLLMKLTWNRPGLSGACLAIDPHESHWWHPRPSEA